MFLEIYFVDILLQLEFCDSHALCHLFTKKHKFNIKVSLQGVADVRQKVGVVLEVECELLCLSMKII